MAILFDKQNKIFTLHTLHSTYQMKIDQYGFLLHLYYGHKTQGCMDYLLTYADRGFSGNPYDTENDRTYSLDVLPQEYPCRLSGDFRSPAIETRNGDGSYGCDLRYKGYNIFEGKYGLSGLPAIYANNEEAQSLEIQLEDRISGLQVKLLYGVLPEMDIITRSVLIRNCGKETITLEKVLSANLDFVTGEYDLLTFYGRHAMERNLQREKIGHGRYVIGSRRGTSSHQYNSMMIISDCNTTEESGKCFSMSFVYSGGFVAEAEKDQFHQTRIQMGLPEEQFSYPLEPEQEFIAPEVVMTFSGEGLGKLSRNLHQCFRTHLCRGKYRDQIRPVLLNSWEASYFSFTGESIFQLAKQAAELGVEMLVLDDGWFGKRDDDNSGLGDWVVNEKKIGSSLGELVYKINDLGLKFGIWIEPEMVNEDSDFYRNHPDWVLKIPGRMPSRSRNQLVLDFSRKEVVDAVYNQICNVLDSANIEYVKWDMNRSLVEMFSNATSNQGKVQYDYILGLYDFLERIVEKYPDILIEGCSGGGGRFDAGMLYYTPQIWCSDNTDAVDRLRIQYGTSFGYPVSAMGAHVSAVPNHQTGRITELNTRGVVAQAGTFGYELNPALLSEDEKNKIRKQIEEYHKYAMLIQTGEYYRLSNPFCDCIGAWEIISKDKSEVLISIVTLENHGNMISQYVCPKGLETGSMYQEDSGTVYPADAIMEYGIPLPQELGEYRAYQLHFKRIM